jgi:hypothetical protein
MSHWLVLMGLALVPCAVSRGEYDHSGGFGLWFDYVWDGNVVKNANFHHNLRPGISIEMAAGVEVTGCTFSSDDLDGLTGEIPAAFRPWDKSPKSGPDLWSGEIMLFNACTAGRGDSSQRHREANETNSRR